MLPLAALRPKRPSSRFNLKPGSVWVAAGVLTGRASTPGGFCGLRIGGGRMVTDAPATSAGGELVLPDGATFTLELTLDPPAAAPATSAVGTDGARASATLPEQLTLRLGGAGPEAGGFTLVELAVWGRTVGLTLDEGAMVRPVWDPDEQAVVIPLAPTATSLAIGASGGAAVTFAGGADITEVGPSGRRRVGAGWAFPISHAAATDLGSASGDGAAMVRVGPGLWFDAHGQPWALADATVTVGPGFLSVLGHRLDAGAARYTTWSSDAGDSFVAVGLPAGEPVLVQEEDGTEAVFAEGSARTGLAVPVDVVGGRLPVAADTALLAWVTTEAGTLFLAFGAATGSRPVALALHNALWRRRVPEASPSPDSSSPAGCRRGPSSSRTPWSAPHWPCRTPTPPPRPRSSGGKATKARPPWPG